MKSHVSNLLDLATAMYYDAVAKCSTIQPDARDLITLRSRVKNEGVSFLTLTLPAFGNDLRKAVSNGRIDPTHFRMFKKCGAIPAFLQGMLGLVFDRGTGRIFDEPSIEAFEGLSQMAFAFKKLGLDCSKERIRKALTKFGECEHDLSRPLAPSDFTRFCEVAHVLWGTVFGGVRFSHAACVPKHGPGATADLLNGNQKFNCRQWYERLEPYFPMDAFRFHSSTPWLYQDDGDKNRLPYRLRRTQLAAILSQQVVKANASSELEEVTLVSEDDELPVRVITVPKTLKGPRIIAIEPTCMQYTQQALSRWLIEHLEADPITGGHVMFTNQERNRTLAMTASKNCDLATLDLSSASDRVPNGLSMNMFNSIPDFRDAIQACRSKRAQTPNGDIIRLKKFASMGSALCFPVEAMYFYTICVAALLEKYNLPVTLLSIKKVGKSVYVYGDDIIVPTDAVENVITYLHKYHCKVGLDKSFWSGNFRESCGMDAFCGEPVTPTYIRKIPPSDIRRDASAVISTVAASNQMYLRGYWRTADVLRTFAEKCTGKLPLVGKDSAALGLISFQPYVSTERWGRRYQRHEVLAWEACPVYRTDKLDGYGALLKCLLKLESSNGDTDKGISSDSYKLSQKLAKIAASDKRHLDRTARHGAVTLKRRWLSPV